MKNKINFTVLCLFLCIGTLVGQTKTNAKSKEFIQKELAKVQQNSIERTKRQAINCVKVMKRHKGKFYKNNTEISFQEAKNAIKKKYNNLAFEVNWKSERIDINL